MTTPIKRVEKRWKPEWGYGPGVTLSCGHRFAGEHDFKSREQVFCPACSDSHIDTLTCWPIWMLPLAQEAKNNGAGNLPALGFTTHDTVVGETRNRRDVFWLSPEPYAEAHFAVMPTKLAELCILAGTSERGCCPECGAPWKRLMERGDVPNPSFNNSRFDTGKTAATHPGHQRGERYLSIATGWEPTCAHGLEPVPAVVLDPFCGSGTTLKVAIKHRRRGFGIELNSDYVALAEKRINGVQVTLPLDGESA